MLILESHSYRIPQPDPNLFPTVTSCTTHLSIFTFSSSFSIQPHPMWCTSRYNIPVAFHLHNLQSGSHFWLCNIWRDAHLGITFLQDSTTRSKSVPNRDIVYNTPLNFYLLLLSLNSATWYAEPYRYSSLNHYIHPSWSMMYHPPATANILFYLVNDVSTPTLHPNW